MSIFGGFGGGGGGDEGDGGGGGKGGDDIAPFSLYHSVCFLRNSGEKKQIYHKYTMRLELRERERERERDERKRCGSEEIE